MHYYIITGTSRGLGKALAEAILQEPNTSVTGISRQAALKHERYQHLPLDLSDIPAVEMALAKVLPDCADATGITLINNAAVVGDIGYMGEQQNRHFSLVFDVNTVAPALLMNAFLRAYGASTCPRTILNISSGAAQRPVDGWAAYCASKAALEMLTSTVRKEQELRGSGIRIRSLSPGVLDTAMQEHIRNASPQGFSEVARFAALHAEGQLVPADHVAGLIVGWLQKPERKGEADVLRLTDLA